MFAACARYQMLYLPGRRGRHLVHRGFEMKERVRMSFRLRTFTASRAIGDPLLLLRGAKRADPVAAAH